MAEDVSSFRRTRVLLALGPLAGTLGAFLGVAVGIDGLSGLSTMAEASWSDLRGLAITFYSLGGLVTLFVAGHGCSRDRPFHALKACAALAVVLFFPGVGMGIAIAGAGC